MFINNFLRKKKLIPRNPKFIFLKAIEMRDRIFSIRILLRHLLSSSVVQSFISLKQFFL